MQIVGGFKVEGISIRHPNATNVFRALSGFWEDDQLTCQDQLDFEGFNFGRQAIHDGSFVRF